MRIICFLIFVVCNSVYANPICSNPFSENKQFHQFLEFKETELKKFSNRKEVASKADETLSKLIAAKSKLIGSWLNKRNLNSASEVEIVKNWRRYYAENFILGSYPNSDQKVNQLTQELIEKLYRKFLPKDKQKSIQNIYSSVKELAIKKVKSYPINAEQKEKVISRLSSINLYWMSNFKSSKFTKQPLEVFSWGVAYDPVDNEINMGLNVLQYANDETLFAVFAHELGHSFDPCRWGAFFKNKNPFQKIVSCLRNPQSVGAKKRDDSKMEALVNSGKLSKELSLALKLNPTCNKIQYPPIGVQADQIAESFADWFSAEVTSDSDFLNNKTRSDLCSSKSLNSGSSYPTNQMRLERIYLAHPKIKKKLKFNGAATYCSF